jgi:peptidoglycan-associated lipoprotein
MTIQTICAAIPAAVRNRCRPAARAAVAVVLLFASLVFGCAGRAQTANTANNQPSPEVKFPIEAAFDFNYIHGNAPVAGCGCFSLLGGGISGAYYYGPQFALVAEFSKTNNDNVDNTSHELTISNYLMGGKFLFPLRKTRIIPYTQILMGVSRDSGFIAQVYPGGSSNYNVFAAALGGGVDYRLKPKLTLRLFKVDYLVTTFPNRADNHQNNLRVTSGAALRF